MIPNKTINVADQFSRFPGGRFLSDGQYSGQGFREQLLVPALSEAEQVTVELDGTLGYGSSFLEEAFGGLVRIHGYSADDLKRRLSFKSNNEALIYAIVTYVTEAKVLKQG